LAVDIPFQPNAGVALAMVFTPPFVFGAWMLTQQQQEET
jgi:hypothetical protein